MGCTFELLTVIGHGVCSPNWIAANLPRERGLARYSLSGGLGQSLAAGQPWQGTAMGCKWISSQQCFQLCLVRLSQADSGTERQKCHVMVPRVAIIILWNGGQGQQLPAQAGQTLGIYRVKEGGRTNGLERYISKHYGCLVLTWERTALSRPSLPGRELRWAYHKPFKVHPSRARAWEAHPPLFTCFSRGRILTVSNQKVCECWNLESGSSLPVASKSIQARLSVDCQKLLSTKIEFVCATS